MGLTTAERNKRKRERKKREKEELKKREEQEKKEKEAAKQDEPVVEHDDDFNNDVQIEYVAEKPILPETEDFESLRRFQEQLAAVSMYVTDEDEKKNKNEDSSFQLQDESGEFLATLHHGDHHHSNGQPVSKRKLREMVRPTVAELKRRVQRPDLVEAHDVTAADPEFLIELKATPFSVPVPRHWGRKRKYLQGKKGFEKPPFKLPEFITRTGITEIRDTVAEDEANMSARQKNRARVAPKMGAIDVDYRTLHDAFFKYQTKPSNLTKFGEIYHEGKELEVNMDIKPGGPLSETLREALGMTSETSPPPWLINMQRYGPPPSYPDLKLPGLNAPLPSPECQYGYHPGGWGKPPVDAYGRPLYGGNPFDPPGSSANRESKDMTMVTSDGKTVTKAEWGALPTGELAGEESEEEEEESSGEEMEEESSEEEEGAEEEEAIVEGVQSVLPPPPISSTAPGDLRKQTGEETPLIAQPPKQLYQVIEQKQVTDQSSGAVFASEVAYVVPGSQPSAAAAPEGAESVLAKAAPAAGSKRKRKDDEEESDLTKNFKF